MNVIITDKLENRFIRQYVYHYDLKRLQLSLGDPLSLIIFNTSRPRLTDSYVTTPSLDHVLLFFSLIPTRIYLSKSKGLDFLVLSFALKNNYKRKVLIQKEDLCLMLDHTISCIVWIKGNLRIMVFFLLSSWLHYSTKISPLNPNNGFK